jgi:ATP-binding cassette subfamily B protein
MVKKVLRYYWDIAMSQKYYSILPMFLSPLGRIGTDYIQPLFTSAIINRLSANPHQDIKNLQWFVVGFFASPFLAEVLWRYLLWLINNNDSKGMEKIGNQVFKDLMSRPYDFHVNNFAGALVAKAGRFVNAYEPLYDTLIMDIGGTLVGVIFATVVLIKIAPIVGLSVLAAICVFSVIIYHLTRKRYALNKLRAEKESLLTGQMADSLTNAITTKTFAKEKYEQKLFNNISATVREYRLRSWQFQNIPMDLITTNSVNLLNTISLIGGIYAVINGHTQIGT